MNKLELLQEFLDMFDSEYKIQYGDCVEVNMDDKEIRFYKSMKHFNEINTYITHHLLIDLGIKWYNYCSYPIFALLHEIGHLEVGKVETDLEYLSRVDLLPNNNNYKKCHDYIRIPDEIAAWNWAYEFLKKNYKIVKQLERELMSLDI